MELPHSGQQLNSRAPVPDGTYFHLVRRERPGEGSAQQTSFDMDRPPCEPSSQPSPGVPGEGVRGAAEQLVTHLPAGPG